MAKKYVYLFSEGNANMRELLGGKGANLAEMTNIGLPVPQGFTITTEACTQYYEDGRTINDEIMAQVNEYVGKMEEMNGKKFGDLKNPLLVSVRSGARASMPGMMDTILNLGLNDDVVAAMIAGNPDPKFERFVYDSYRRFIQMFSDVVMEVGKKYFEQLIDQMKERKGVKFDVELTAADLKELACEFKAEYKKQLGVDFPSDPQVQLYEAIRAVFRSWDNPRANVYRRDNDIPYSWGTAVNVMPMVFGNLNDNSGTGVVIQVAEHHRHDVDGSAPAVGDVVVTAIHVGAGVVPAAEHGADGLIELDLGIGGEIDTQLLFILGLELAGQLLQIGGGQLHVELDALALLHLVDELLEVLLAHLHDHVGEHLDEAAVGVVDEPLELGVGVAGDHGGDHVVVEAEVQDGVHHAGHGGAGAGADRDKQGILQIPELLAVHLLHLSHILVDLRHDLVVDGAAVLVILGAGLGGDGEALGHRQPDVGHLRQVRALAAQKLTHVGVALGKQVDILFCHFVLSFLV